MREIKMNLTGNTWKFPSNIEFEEVTNYLKKFEKLSHDKPITFDLSDTENIHSSFIGFLIHAKRKIEKENGELTLIISRPMEKIFSMLNLHDYWVCSYVSRIA